MPSLKDSVRKQRRRELDARRSKSRVRLGSCLESWGRLKETLGFSLHSELARYLLDSYFSRACSRCSGDEKSITPRTFLTTAASLQHLVVLVHNHSQKCPLPPVLHHKVHMQAHPKGSVSSDYNTSVQAEPEASIQTDPIVAVDVGAVSSVSSIRTNCKDPVQPDSKMTTQPSPVVHIQSDPINPTQPSPRTNALVREVEDCLKFTCKEGHVFTWCPAQTEPETEGGEKERDEEQGDVAFPEIISTQPHGQRKAEEDKMESVNERSPPGVRTRCSRRVETVPSNTPLSREEGELGEDVSNCSRGDEEPERPEEEKPAQEGSASGLADSPLNHRRPPGGNEMDTEGFRNVGSENQSSVDSERNTTAVPASSKRGRQRRADLPEKKRTLRQQPVKEDVAQICSRRKRKATPKLILPCEFEGCWKIFSSRQYLNHHMKYQHFQQKTFICSHPSCGKSFNFKKHLKEHEKLHSDQKDYICEFCARAFRTSSNLSIHRRIHTGEKPLQCEVCGFTCIQKASLNWHMKKHDAESSYQFPCEICGRRFEKRDNVTAHKSKSHPENTTSTPTTGSSKDTKD
ncbi:zinc finger protein 692 isoform X2 [Hoplias malabaricus]|uniref:zinc finger protein 692 isoform X2 n=1 Tax=Hoplias malabaricus TaxID=27720 RepID=UPI0034631C98